MDKVRIVCATRVSGEKFFSDTALGRSLALYGFLGDRLEYQVYPGNTRGLPQVYNEAIEQAFRDPALMVFAHDDICLNDFFWFDKLQAALRSFNLVGLAGNRRRVPGQPAWCFLDEQGTRERPEHLSGIVGAGEGFPCQRIVFYGAMPQECKLLDGMFLAVDSATLRASGIRFDPRFHFHFYDMDFCRQAESRGLRMGTWPIAVVHESGGAFRSKSWKKELQQYRRKYGE